MPTSRSETPWPGPPPYPPTLWGRTPEEWLAIGADLEAAEAVLRELKENSRGEIADPHFRHWSAATIAAYFSGKAIG